jgi:8-oxo-dGTP pyrophosphatase MutT (NUDIX family)
VKKIWDLCGVVAFWMLWPALWFYLHGTKRTRVLLICGDEFLVVRAWLSPGYWQLSGGGLHPGEDPLAGLIREVQEETSISLEPQKVSLLLAGVQHHETGFRFSYDCFVAELAVKPAIKPENGEITGHT